VSVPLCLLAFPVPDALANRWWIAVRSGSATLKQFKHARGRSPYDEIHVVVILDKCMSKK